MSEAQKNTHWNLFESKSYRGHTFVQRTITQVTVSCGHVFNKAEQPGIEAK